MTIHKYPLKIGANKIEMPFGARILTAQYQLYQGVLWAMVDRRQLLTTRNIVVLPTGIEFPAPENDADMMYISTYQDSMLVFHVFEVVI